MILFYCTSLARLPQLRAHGAHDALLWRTWDHARRTGSEVLLAAKYSGLAHLSGAGGLSVYAGHVPPEAFLNLSPYRPVVGMLAAGGIVLRAQSQPPEVMMIFRNGCWDLPKGKLDDGETLRMCALREVQEETGAEDLVLYDCVGVTTHGYVAQGKYVVKYTYWYLMSSRAVTFTPQESEDVTAVRWTRWADTTGKVGYDTLRQLLDRITVQGGIC